MQLRSRTEHSDENVPSMENLTIRGPKPSERPVVRRRPLGDISNALPIHAPRPTLVAAPIAPIAAPAHVPVAMDLETPIRQYMDRPAGDIDERDKYNPNCCPEIINQLFHSFRRVEREFPITNNYLTNQGHLNEKMRKILVDWLVDIHARFKMVPETLYLAINYIDRYLQVEYNIRRSKLQLVGITALFIASKYEEIYAPSIDQYVEISGNAYSKKDILKMEFDICGKLNFQLTVPTAHAFLCRCLKAANVDSIAMVQLCSYITEMSLLEYDMLQFPPSIIAAAAVSIARQSSNRFSWSPTLLKYTGYDECHIEDCVRKMEGYLPQPSDAPAQQQTVYKKYSSSRYGKAAHTHLSFR